MSSSPHPHKIYTDLLLAKGFGYPLYYPEPCRNAVRRGWSGVSIGDVGTINNDGGFDFRFNVIKKPDDPTSNELDMRRGAVGHRETTSVANGLPLHAELSFYNPPPAFDPIVLEEWEIRYNDNDCHPGKVIGRYITHTLSIDGQISLAQIPYCSLNSRTFFYADYPPIRPVPINSGLAFNIECNREKAASLILPNGATRVEIDSEQLVRFNNLARQHGASWLRRFTGTSLCLVTGCVKTNSWALMSLYGSSNIGGLSLKFGVAPTTIGAGPSWTWLEAGPADTRHSPVTGDQNQNHCVFLRGIRISKRDPKWWPFKRQVHVEALGMPPLNGESSHSPFGNTTGTQLAPTSSNSGGQQADDGQGSNSGVGHAASRKLSQNANGDNIDLKSVTSPDVSPEGQCLDDDIVIEPLTEAPPVSPFLYLFGYV